MIRCDICGELVEGDGDVHDIDWFDDYVPNRVLTHAGSCSWIAFAMIQRGGARVGVGPVTRFEGKVAGN